jgi:histidinol-phosphate aminotransferase
MGGVTSLNDLPLRDNLRGLTPYGAPQLHVPVALNVNENTHGIPEDVAGDIAAALAVAIRGINRYPDRDFWAANGSNEVLQQTLQAFGGPGRTLLGFAPTYSMYPLLASGTGTRWVAGDRDADFEITPQRAVDWVNRVDPDLVFLCSPNNPTGTPLSLDVIAAVYDACDGIVVVDEAYAEFARAGTPSALTLLEGRDRLVVTRTMSKAFALAGGRLGYLVAARELTDALRLVRLPYHLSATTQAVACAALEHAEGLLATVELLKTQRDRLVSGLAEMGLHPVPSDANFVLFGGLADEQATWKALLDEGILIRDVGLSHYLRVTAGTPQETEAFLGAMRRLTPTHRQEQT